MCLLSPGMRLTNPSSRRLSCGLAQCMRTIMSTADGQAIAQIGLLRCDDFEIRDCGRLAEFVNETKTLLLENDLLRGSNSGRLRGKITSLCSVRTGRSFCCFPSPATGTSQQQPVSAKVTGVASTGACQVLRPATALRTNLRCPTTAIYGGPRGVSSRRATPLSSRAMQCPVPCV
jgi:hypothetical protein